MGCIVYASINDFFGEYLRDCSDKLKNFEIIVCSRAIVSSLATRNQETGQNDYSSKYKNVTFLYDIVPSPAVMEFMSGSSHDRYTEAYMRQLESQASMEDICCMIDLVVNDDKNIFILTSNSEYLKGHFEIFEEFVALNFKFRVYSYSDMINDPDIIYQYGDKDEIKVTLAYQMEQIRSAYRVTCAF